jgi:glycosyltransferase involved in cell wall biosynthesis
VAHGVDHGYFSRVLSEEVRPAEDIKHLKRPIIGFFGLIHEWIDLDLIEKIAASHPDWSVALIGKVSVSVERFSAYDNVHFLGRKPYDRLINYCKAFDVGLIPFLINELTVNVNPIKLREYIAAGIPVISTPLPEVKKYSHLVKIGHNAKEVIEHIEVLLKDDTYEKKVLRSRRMMQDTWESKVQYISNLISRRCVQADQ